MPLNHTVQMVNYMFHEFHLNYYVKPKKKDYKHRQLIRLPFPPSPSQPSFEVSSSLYPEEDGTLGADGTLSFPKYDIRLSQVCRREKDENGPHFKRM